MSATTEALVLRFVDFGESDRIVHLLTPDQGRVAAIAKGARRSRKRFPGTLDLFNHLHVQFARPGRRRPTGMRRLEVAKLERTFLAPRRDLGCFALACYLLELLDRAAPEGGRSGDLERLFRFALEALSHLEVGGADRRLRVLYELRALDALGFRPEFANCVRCGREALEGAPAGAYPRFLVAEGGALCEACQRPQDGAIALRRGTLRALSQALELPVGALRRLALSGEMLDEADRLVRHFQHFHLGLELRSQSFVDRLS